MNEHEGHDAGEAPLAAVDVDTYEPASELLRALMAPIRLALVDTLAQGPRCVHELVDALSISQPLVSQHLKVLRGAGLVDTSRRGREIVYRLVDEHVSHVVRDTVAHAAERRSDP